jgi:hypothetical protein
VWYGGWCYSEDSTKPFFKLSRNRVVRNLIHTKLKKGLEFVTNLETFFRFRMTPFFPSVSYLFSQFINVRNHVLQVSLVCMSYDIIYFVGQDKSRQFMPIKGVCRFIFHTKQKVLPFRIS